MENKKIIGNIISIESPETDRSILITVEVIPLRFHSNFKTLEEWKGLDYREKEKILKSKEYKDLQQKCHRGISLGKVELTYIN